MKKITTILFIICTTLFISCSSFLDEKPTNQADSNTSILNAKDAKVMINGLMRKMTSYDYYGRNFIMYGDAKGGDFAISSQGRGLDGLYTFNHSESSGSYSGFWGHLYNCILQANNLIKNIDKLIENGQGNNELKQYRAEAMTARAMFYYDLVRLYGKPYDMDKSSYGVSITLEPLDASALPTRSSVEQVYTQIMKDLTDAALDLSTSTGTNMRGYLNYYANRAIQARVYLQMQNYGEALKAAEEIIESKKYTPYKNDEWVSSWTKQWGSESIFELGIFPSEGDLTTGSLGFYLRRQSHGSTSAMGYFMASDSFLARLGEDADDVRWGIMDYDERSTTRFGSCYKYSGAVNTTVTNKDATFPGDGKATATAVNIKVIRLSEIYLIAAEAALHSDTEKAAKYLNEIRKRSPNLTPATSSTVTLEMVLDEKSKELFAEGHRFFDMMRLNKSITFNDDFITPAVSISTRNQTIDRTFYRTILPISLDEMNANPEIANQQNPGY